MLLYCRWKVYKMRMSRKFWLTVSTNGVLTRLNHKGKSFHLFWFRFGWAWLWLAEKFFQKCRWPLFFVVATRLSCKKLCTITAKQHCCRFLVLKRNIQNVAAGFALFRVVGTSPFIGWNINAVSISTCWARHISNSLLYIVVHTQFFLALFGCLKWEIR